MTSLRGREALGQAVPDLGRGQVPPSLDPPSPALDLGRGQVRSQDPRRAEGVDLAARQGTGMGCIRQDFLSLLVMPSKFLI